MADIKLYGSFIAEKLSKVRFVQEKYKLADTFVSGSWGLSKNAINLWQLTKDEFSMDDDDGDYVPKSIAKVAVDGDVTGLEFLNADTIVCSTSSTNGILFFSSTQRSAHDDFIHTITFPGLFSPIVVHQFEQSGEPKQFDGEKSSEQFTQISIS